jgi:hypothetical protein
MRTIRRTFAVGLVLAGMAIGFAAARLLPEPVVTAQGSGWQCQSWSFTKGESVAPVAAWLGQARNAQITSAGLSVAGLYNLVACKQ